MQNKIFLTIFLKKNPQISEQQVIQFSTSLFTLFMWMRMQRGERERNTCGPGNYILAYTENSLWGTEMDEWFKVGHSFEDGHQGNAGKISTDIVFVVTLIICVWMCVWVWMCVYVCTWELMLCACVSVRVSRYTCALWRSVGNFQK